MAPRGLDPLQGEGAIRVLILSLILFNVLIFAGKAWAKKPHHSPRFLTAQRLNHGLRHSPMAHLGFELEAAGYRYRISPYFMAAIAGTESSLGAAACPNNRFNVWGLASCNQSWNVPAFRSWHEAIHYFARFLRSHWPSARTAYDFSGYAACTSCWASHTAYFMHSLFGVGPSVRYP